MTVLITGGAGFIGAQLAREFLRRGERVVVFDKAVHDRLFEGEKNVSLVRGDITSAHEVLNVVRDHKVHTIFHLAGILSAVSEANPWACIDINAMGTYHVLEAARLFGVGKVIFTSSMGSYTVNKDIVVTDETKQNPTLIYGVTKVFGELLGLYYHRKFGIDFRGIRLPQLIGPNVKTFGFGQYNPWLIEAAVKGEPFSVWAPEDTVLPLLYIKDAIRSLIMLHDTDEAGLFTRVYNIGQIMPPPTARDVVDEVKRHYPDAQITFEVDPAAEIGLATIPKIIRSDEAEKEWGWKVTYSLSDTIVDFIHEYKKTVE
ncbi:MAG: SDR family NAD(P)-dependent oxidoreductase [Syntrophorhabdales bacterium]|jgi:nucleoside-diphosphate-sugar epimerase